MESLIIEILKGIVIGLWAYLVTSPLQDEGEVFQWVRKMANNILDPGWEERGQSIPNMGSSHALPGAWFVYKILTCGKCQAFYWWLCFSAAEMMWTNAPLSVYALIVSVFTAWWVQEKM